MSTEPGGLVHVVMLIPCGCHVVAMSTEPGGLVHVVMLMPCGCHVVAMSTEPGGLVQGGQHHRRSFLRRFLRPRAW